MKQFILALLLSLFYFHAPSLHACEQKVVQAKGLEFWTETFGNKEDPAILLGFS